MGSIVTRDDALHVKLKGAHMRLGWGVGANDAETILRSLPTIEVRYRAHDQAARVLANWLRTRPEIVQVLHPALEGSPGHQHWKAMCGDDGLAAGLFSVVFDGSYSPAQVDGFCDALRLFKLGYSWGGPVSLVVPYDIPSMRRNWQHKGTLVRFSVGLEDVDDLRDDLEQALRTLG
jgi:cystathionine beta-lyase